MKTFIFIIAFAISTSASAQTSDTLPDNKNAAKHLYHINPWITGSVIAGGGVADILALSVVRNKSLISDAEFTTLNRNDINRFDRWAIDLNTAGYAGVEKYATIVNTAGVLLPLAMFFDSRIGKDWGTILAMYLEVHSISLATYLASPLGPLFQNKFRPIVYYDNLTRAERNNGTNRNSFYSGHTASVATASFFFAKVYSDYHPEMGADKYWLFAAALVPPLTLGYIRIKGLNHFPSDVLSGLGIGALCGILVPELHRFKDKTYSFGVYSNPQATGLYMSMNIQ